MADKVKTDYVALSKHIQSKGYKRNANQKEIDLAKKEMASKMKSK